MEKVQKTVGWGSWNAAKAAARDTRVWSASMEALCANWHEVMMIMMMNAYVTSRSLVPR